MGAPLLHCATGTFSLRRYPERPRETLQAWNAADELLVAAVHEATAADNSSSHTPALLTVNDEHGALSVALQPKALWTDSFLAKQALEGNLTRNQKPFIDVVPSTDAPPSADIVAMRIPKSLGYFRAQLSALANSLPPGGRLFAAGMDKHLSPNTAQLLEDYIGPTQRQPGKRKARVFVATRDQRVGRALPTRATYRVPGLPVPLSADTNVFSPDMLDGGTRLLLPHLADIAACEHAVDLACGNGVIGHQMLHQKLARRVTFIDESAMAVASARHNANVLLSAIHETHSGDSIDGSALRFVWGDGATTREAANLVTLNPPFHMGHAVDQFAGRRLILQASKMLEKDGQLLLVYNNHLKYKPLLRRRFETLSTLSRDRRFSVIVAGRPVAPD
ncbi:class I SAM-dependent methyltransferase [Halioglobus pacificus]|uniref:Ribosomal RNA large subunit methyltransferase G n=1 Tax=Parahalioglobus pacificus TaxID=930806 RepID=A0A918XG33_9GAMM|nr:methyltransferase [Halioglobus pacificus]GHD29662.1 ribosomal RNA large subunit methyltransferase G [Halioglobus pacificus]